MHKTYLVTVMALELVLLALAVPSFENHSRWPSLLRQSLSQSKSINQSVSQNCTWHFLT